MDKFGTAFAVTLAITLALGLVSLIGFPIYKSIAADGKVEYCYVSTETYTVPNQPNVVMYHLWGFRPWRSDRDMARNLKSLEEAKQVAANVGCDIR